MDKVCAVIDCQGFFINKIFHVRELALASDSMTVCQEFRPLIDYKTLSNKDKFTIEYNTKKIHGLSLFPLRNNLIPSSDEVPKYIHTLYKMVGSEQRPLLAVKNSLLKDYILAIGLPVYDLSETNCPNLQQLEKEYGASTCGYHRRDFYKKFIKGKVVYQRKRYRCAYRKSLNLFKWVKENLTPEIQ